MMPRTRKALKPRVSLQSLLRSGLLVASLKERAESFAQSAQIDHGRRAPSDWRMSLAGCLDAFINAIEGGIAVDNDPATSLILFRTFHYEIDASRTGYRLTHIPTGNPITLFDVGSPMRTFAWVAGMRLAQDRMVANDAMHQWINDRLTRFARRHIDGIALRVQLASLLAPCPIALLRARRAAAAHWSRADCTATWLQRCATNAAILDEVQRIAPGALALVGHHYAQANHPIPRDALREVRRAALNSGVRPAEWAQVTRKIPRCAWATLAKRAAAPFVFADEVLGAWCHVHRGLPQGQRLSRSMWLTLLRPNGEGVSDALTLPTYWRTAPRLIESAISAFNAAQRSGTEADFLSDWARVIRWLANFVGRGVGRAPTSFQSALRRAIKDERVACAIARSKEVMFPDFPIDTWTYRELKAIDLATPLSLVMHSIQQAHCGEMLIDACIEGSLRVFGVHDEHTGLPIGTVSLRLTEDGWRPSNAKHFANRPPSLKLVGFAFQLASAVERTLGRAFAATPLLRRQFLASSPS
jgi:hypothetical protein